jgi:hypothetical protein
MFQRKYHMHLKFYQITKINDNIHKYPLLKINEFITYRGVYILDIIDLYILDIIDNIDRISSLCEKQNILISSMPTKVHDEQCLLSAHS